MISTTLHQVGNSVILFIPAEMLNLLGIRAGEPINMWVEKGNLIIQPQQQGINTFRQISVASYPEATLSDEERAWLTNFPRKYRCL